MPLYPLLTFFSLLSHLYLTLYSMRGAGRPALRRVFSLLCVCFAIWSLSATAIHITAGMAALKFWTVLGSLGWCFFAGLFLHFILALTGKLRLLNRKLVFAAIYLPAAFFLFLGVANILSAGNHITGLFGNRESSPSASVWFWMYMAYVFICVTSAGAAAWIPGPVAKTREAKRSRSLTFYASGVFILTAMSVVIPELSGMTGIPSLAPVITLLWAVGVCRAIVRHSFLRDVPALSRDEILNHIKDLVLILNPKGTITAANKAAHQFLGLDEHGLIGRNLSELVKKGDNPGKLIDKLVPGSVREFEFETFFKGASGTEIPVDITVSPISDCEGDLVAMVAIAHDQSRNRLLRQEMKERILTEGALRESEEVFREITDNISDLIAIIDKRGVYLYVSPSHETVLGYARDELIGKSAFDFLHPDDTPRAFQLVHRGIGERAPQHADLRLVSRGGEYRWYDVMGNIIQDDTGEIRNIIISCRDISFKIAASQAIRESEEKYRNILNAMEEGYFEVDLTGNFTYFNPSLRDMIGYTDTEMVGMNYRSYMDSGNAAKVFSTFKRVFRSCESTSAFNWELFTREGRTITVETSISLIRGRDGSPAGFRGIVRDVTERKAVENRLRESEERFRNFVTNAGDIIWSGDKDGYITYVNPTALRLLDCGEKDILGKQCFDIIHPLYREKASRFFGIQYVKKIPNTYYEFPVLVKNAVVWFGQNLSILFENGEVKEFLGVARDITERKHVADMLRESEERYRTLTENSSDIICEMDMEGKYLYVSSNVSEKLGYAPGELLGKAFFDFIHPLERENAKGNWSRKQSQFLLRFRHRDGTWRWLDSAARIFMLSDGQERVVSISRDITERKREEQLLWENEMRLRLQQMALTELAKHESLYRGNLIESFKIINMVGCHNLDVDRCGIWLFGDDRASLKCFDIFDVRKNCHYEGREVMIADDRELVSLLEELRIVDADDAARDERAARFIESYIRDDPTVSLLVAAFRLGGDTVGVLVFDLMDAPRVWTPEEKRFGASLADFASLAMETHNRRLAEDALRVSEEMLRRRTETIDRDLKNAQIIQRALLPDRIPAVERIKLDFRNYSVDAVGGDYFSFTPLQEGGLGVFIGDVSGHGVSAALFLSLLKATADRACRRYGQRPREFIKTLNHDLIENMPHYFVTAIYGYFANLNGGTGSINFTFSKGGHPNPIIYRAATGRLEMINCRGTILGKFDYVSFDEQKVELSRGDRVFLYTDGLPETANSENRILGFNELLPLIERVSTPDLSETLDAIIGSASAFRGNAVIEDDIVLIGCEVQ